ncbi:hypothetical protein IFM89_020801 [Coptis chinensis]|uniref:FAR1 domain-containing protein n=1 Tax=Coptis chinensis TaxID=261450 RepID=A0A835IWR0_9MAGN|nr:hypothetical protein IFM89_020801 [Coptis chinensis]
MENLLYEGLVFQSEEEAYASYNSYARKMGFSIRKDKIYYRTDRSHRTVRRRFFVCFKEGVRKKDKWNGNVKNNRNETRIGCKARMTVLNVKNEWVVTEVVYEHNYELATPSKTYLLRSQRRVKEPQ